MRARVIVLPRPEILDPQGRAVAHALAALHFGGVADVRVGRVVDLNLQDGLERGAAELQVRKMAQDLLANPIVEDFAIQWLD